MRERWSVGARLRFILVEGACFAIFALAYFLPLFLDLTDSLIQDQRVAALVADLLATGTCCRYCCCTG
jgi:hypothetical protein